MKNTIIINTVKDQADINTPTVLTGYLLNGNHSVPLSQGNKEYRAIQEWIAEGNTPEVAYTQEQLVDYIHSKEVQEALGYLAKTDWYVVRKFETGTEEPNEIKVKRTEARIIAN